MNVRTFRIAGTAVVAAAAVVFASAAPPPTMFLTSTPARPEVGRSVDVQWIAGAGRDAQSAPWPDQGVAWMFVRAGGSQYNRQGVRAARPGGASVTVDITQPGVTVIGIDQRPVSLEMTGAELREFIEQRVGDPAVREKARELVDDRTYRVQHIASAKLLVRARSVDSRPRPAALAMSKTGQAVELRPAADPTALRVGSDLPLTAYIAGAKKEKIRVLATHAATGRSAAFQEVSGGSGYFRIGEAGPWRVEFHHAEPAADPQDAEWVLYTGTLSFEVEAQESTPPAAGPSNAEVSQRGVTVDTPSAPAVRGPRGGIVEELGPSPVNEGETPFTGRVSAIACSRTDPNLYYVAGADGGVWRTTDGGTTWTPLTDHMPTSAIGALALDPTNENVIYAGTGEANYANHSRYGLGLYKSTDGGLTWTLLGADTFAGRTFARIIVHPLNSQRVYAAIGRAGGFPALAAAKGHPGRNGPVGIFRSDDGGLTWTQLTNGLPNEVATDLAINPANPDILYAAIGNIFGSTGNGIFKTTDGGNSWTRLSGGMLNYPEYLGRISVAVAPSQPDRIYTLITRPANAAGDGASVRAAYRSDNGGTTWSNVLVPSIQATYGWYLSVVSVHPSDPNIVFMGGVTLVRSVDAGLNFATVTPPHVDMHAAEWDAAGRLVVGDDGGVHRSTDLGDSWSSHNHGLGLIQFYAGLSTHPTDDHYLLGGMQDNGSAYRQPNSTTWTQVFGGDGGWTQLDTLNPLRFFVEYQGSGNLYRTEDGGLTVNFSGSGIGTGDRNCFLPPYLIRPGDSTRMLYATHRLYRSTNGGASWSVLTGDLTGGGSAAIRCLAIAPSDPNVVYIVTNDGRMQRSGDGGSTFSLMATGIPGWPRITRELFVHPTDPNTVYHGVGYYGENQVRRSSDGGMTWQALDSNLPDVPVNTIAADVRPARHVIYAGADDGVYRSIDGGMSWHRFAAGLPNAAVIDLRLEPERNRLIIATQGRGAWSAPIGVPGDCNCDGEVSFADVDYFVATIGDAEQAWRDLYASQHGGASPPCTFWNADLTGDGHVTFADVDGFVEVLTASR